jgi:hypothetical protein
VHCPCRSARVATIVKVVHVPGAGTVDAHAQQVAPESVDDTWRVGIIAVLVARHQ